MTGWDPEKITFFAKTDARGQQVPFGIKAKDRQRHMYVIGKTGMGKSTLLENMAAQDIKNGEGMAFIDPHGSAIETLLEYVPEDRLDDVVYFAPFDMENPVSFNIMEDVGEDTRHLVVSGLMSTFKKIWEDAWSARMEYILTNALLALIEYPDTTLLSVNRMLADKAYRDKVVDHVKDPAVKAYWVDEFASYTERFAAEALPAIQNKIGQFTGNPLIRNIIGQPNSSFDVRKMMDEKKILLINLSKGLVGETNADLLGSMLITKIYLAAMSRADLPPAQMKEMPNFYFYVDEFQSFANSTFANILSEARKYHLNLIIAHQYVAQMEEKVRDAVFGNVGTTITFRVGPFDGEVLETIFAPQFEAVDLVNLGFAQIYLSLMIDGVGSAPFSAVTLPPVEPPAKSHKFMVIKRSQQNYARPRAEVEQAVIDSHSPDDRIEAAEESGGGNKGGFTKPSGFHKVGKDKDFVKQKERLKNGGSRLKGPAQTPPGGGEKKIEPKTASSQIEQKPRPKKPAEKTPDDLRAILAGMTGVSADKSLNKESASEPKESTAVPTKDQSAKSVVLHQSPAKQEATPQPERIESKSRPEQKQNNRQNQKPRPAEKTPDDLRVVLAKMTESMQKPDAASQSQRSKPRDGVVTSSEQVAKPDKKPDSRKTESLQSALEGVIDKVNQKTAENTQSHKPQPERPTQVETKPQSKTPVATVARLVTQSSEPPIGGVRQPAFEHHSSPATPDLATVKKILKTTGKDRPPGM